MRLFVAVDGPTERNNWMRLEAVELETARGGESQAQVEIAAMAAAAARSVGADGSAIMSHVRISLVRLSDTDFGESERQLSKSIRAGGRERGAPPGAEASPVITAFRRAPGGAVHGQDPHMLISQRSESPAEAGHYAFDAMRLRLWMSTLPLPTVGMDSIGRRSSRFGIHRRGSEVAVSLSQSSAGLMAGSE